MFVLTLALVAGCAPTESGPADASAPTLAEESNDARGVVALLNAGTTTFEVLDVDVGLDRRAAANLIEARPFGAIAEVEAVTWVGPVAMRKLIAYARANGWVPDDDELLGTFDGVPFTIEEAMLALDLVNTAPELVLRDGVRLDRRAVQSILGARPIDSMVELAELYYVGSAMLQRIKAFVSAREVGVVSDLDKTVIPPDRDAPYPGVASLYTALEGRTPGDVYYVTARGPDAIDGVPEWLYAHGVPVGPISTGVSPIPSVARAEKVRDIGEIFEANPDQQFVLIGDTNHVDPDAFRDVMALYPEQVVAAFVHDVKDIDDARLEGLVLFAHHDEVAQALAELGVLY